MKNGLLPASFIFCLSIFLFYAKQMEKGGSALAERLAVGAQVNEPPREGELEAIRRSVLQGRPYSGET